MRSNIEMTGGLVMRAAVMMGRAAPWGASVRTTSSTTCVLDSANYLGQSGVMVDRMLERME